MTPLERALIRSVRWLIPGLAMAAVGLAVRTTSLVPLVIIQLSLIVTFGLGVTLHLVELVNDRWFTDWKPTARRLGAGASVVALVTGVVALITLASSAALGLKPSLQFLQLLSALDIAWSTAALIIGVNWKWGRPLAVTAGVLLSIACVWSIWRYLSIVGFSAGGGWLVDGSALWRYVLPFDIGAAFMALTAFLAGARQPTAQRSPQS